MNILQEMVFISEIVLQSKIAQRAAERLEATHTNFDQVEVWCSIQSILVAAGNVSKILWPIKKEHKMRGEKLRQLLKVESDSILSDRKFRNYFEHYDERIEDWFKNSPSAVYRDVAMNPSFTGFMSSSVNRGYNSFNNTLVFRGETLDLNAILNVLEGVLEKCKGYGLT